MHRKLPLDIGKLLPPLVRKDIAAKCAAYYLPRRNSFIPYAVAEAEKSLRMAVVDALSAKERRRVHEYGFNKAVPRASMRRLLRKLLSARRWAYEAATLCLRHRIALPGYTNYGEASLLLKQYRPR